MDNNKNISDQLFAEVGDMVQSGIGSIPQTTCTIIKMKEELEVQSSTLFPMLVSPTQITMNSSININSSNNPVCVINNPTVPNSNISFRHGANFWTTGMRSGNFVIASNYITTNRAGGNIQNDLRFLKNEFRSRFCSRKLSFNCSSILIIVQVLCATLPIPD